MFQKIFSFFLLLLLVGIGNAQAQKTKPTHSKIRALHIEYVTGKMNMTPEQTKKFLPLYNKYSDDLLEVYRAKWRLRKNPNSTYVIDERQKLEQKIVNIKGAYKNDFLKIISPKQLSIMYQSEDEFKRMLIERLKKDKQAKKD